MFLAISTLLSPGAHAVDTILVNGKIDHLTPIGNLYMALESGPPDGRVARVYPDDGHIAAKNEREWGPAAWKWLRAQLTR